MNIAGLLSQAMWGNPAESENVQPDEATLHDTAKELGLGLPDQVTGLLHETAVQNLLKPVDVLDMRENGRAGLLQFTQDEWDSAIVDARSVDNTIGQSWMEVVPLRDGHLLAYPQSADMESFRVAVWLPIAHGTNSHRLVAVDLGWGINGNDFEPLRVVGNTGCTLAFDGEGEDMRFVCLESGCHHGCDEFWTATRGRLKLTGCACS